MNQLLESLGSLSGAAAYVMVGLFATLETAALVGLFVPGELAMLAGGYIAYQDKAELVPMMIVATVCAIVGDSLGYQLGRRFGPSLKRTRLGRRVGEDRWARAENYLVTRGGRAVFFGRFIGVMRALVPALAGVSRMPYRRFVVWSALGGILWAPTIVGLGYLAGSSYRRVEDYAGRAGLVLLGLLVTIAGVAALGRWVANHPQEFWAFVQRQASRPLPARLHQRYRAQLQFIAGRLRPGRALGLALTLQLLLLVATGVAFGAVVAEVLADKDPARVDLRITRTLVDHRVDWLNTAMDTVTEAGSVLVLTPLVLVGGLLARRLTRSWAPLLILVLCLAGAALLDDVVKPLIGRPRPRVGPILVRSTDFAFPSGHATQSAAVYGALAYVVSGCVRSWRAKVAWWTVALVVVLLVGFSRVYLGVHWATDVLGGFALGGVWLAAVLVTTSVVRGTWFHRSSPPTQLPPPRVEAGMDR
ncbi:MAG: bifunctional DedA family/phosphatase PAP2 family protein [Actinomycetota bacterium]|nr:bifunctional DedA family/phosphatase PAP2 family protein [Actinomycetota bacterium]